MIVVSLLPSRPTLESISTGATGTDNLLCGIGVEGRCRLAEVDEQDSTQISYTVTRFSNCISHFPRIDVVNGAHYSIECVQFQEVQVWRRDDQIMMVGSHEKWNQVQVQGGQGCEYPFVLACLAELR